MKATVNLLAPTGYGKLFYLTCIILNCSVVNAAETFNTSLMVGDSSQADWNNQGQTILSGVYDLDIYINGSWSGNFPVKVDSGEAFWLSGATLKALPIKYIDKKAITKKEWVPVAEILYGGQATLNRGMLRLNLTIPQARIDKKDRRWIAPELWDAGINGAFTNYSLSYNNLQQHNNDGNADNVFLSLSSGINLAHWQLVDNSQFQRMRSRQGEWNTQSRYVERALPAINSLFRIGDSYTNSPWFDNVRFRGITLKQDQRMYPDSYRTYMPVIRGNATANAVVSVYQNGSAIYQTNVPPGPFVIDDLMPGGSRSDLTVEVANAGGITERFTVPYSTVSDMLRSGSSEWLLTAGNVQLHDVDLHPAFVQGNGSHGINNYLTLYSGATLSQDYASFLLGGAFSLPRVGSFSTNVDMARAHLNSGESMQGERWKLAYSRFFMTKTNLTLATYYYNTARYLSLYDTVQTNALAREENGKQYLRSKQSFSVNLDQTLPPGWGRIAIDGLWRQYWNSDRMLKQYSLTYSNLYKKATWSLAFRRNHYEYDGSEEERRYSSKSYDEQRIDLAVTIPLSLSGNRHSVTLRTSLQDGKYSGMEAGVNSSLESLDYSLNFSHDRTGHSAKFGAYSAWRTPYAKLTGQYSEASDFRQLGIGASGSAVLWRDGVLASGNTGNTFVILDAPGIAQATVNGNPNMRTNRAGRVLVPSVTPYRMNTYLLDNPRGESEGELLGNIGRVTPWAGSINYVQYKTDTRAVFTFKALFDNGQPLPFGAGVTDAEGNSLGYVAQGSLIYLKAKQLPEWLHVQLTEGQESKTCRIHLANAAQTSFCVR